MNGNDPKRGSDKLVTLNRRGFMQALGISGATVATACDRIPDRHALPYLIAPEHIVPGVPVRYASTCTGCAAACGLMVTVRDGRPIKLEGNPDHPLSRGGLCALGQAEVRGLYDDGRLRGPALGGTSSSWTAVDNQVRGSLAELQRSGKPVHVLTTTLTSPTARRTILDFVTPRGGRLFETDPDPGSPSAALEAYEAIDGRRMLPALDFSRTDLLVVLGADLLGTGPDPVVHTSGYAARRAGYRERGPLRHIQVEGSLSLTGAAADERLAATASERSTIALWLMRAVAGRVNNSEALTAVDATRVPAQPPLGDRIVRLADELYQARGRSMLVSGSNNLTEQVAVAMCNRLLGNEAGPLDLDRPSRVRNGLDRELAELRTELAAGRVGGLFVVGLDPVDQLVDGAQWAEWLKALPLSVAITDRPTATASACNVLAAAHHGLESWHDFSPRPGVLTLAQPTIRPLHDTRHGFAGFLIWGGAAETDYRTHLRESWRRTVFPSLGLAPESFDGFWHEAVKSSMPKQVPAFKAEPGGSPRPLRSLLAAVPAKDDGAMEVELVAHVGVRDGSRAFNPWLRELPEPLSRVSWSPTVAVAPSRAKQLGVSDGDELKISVGDAAVVMAVKVMPGQHPDVLGVPVGYGRVDGDRHKSPRNGYTLPSEGAVSTSRAGKAAVFPLAQMESKATGHTLNLGIKAPERHVIHQLSSYDEKIPELHHSEAKGNMHSLWEERPESSPHWHMSIDLDACTGCSACVVACQAENNTPVVGPQEIANNRDLYWMQITRYFAGDDDNPEVLFKPLLCAQCDNAPCETVCPVAATLHSQDGINQQAYNRCIGTRYCANNCPYKVRRFNWFDYEKADWPSGREKPLERLVLNPDVVVRERGVMEKCNFCVQRVQLARIEARNKGDKTVQEPKTACQQSCPANAIQFGDETNANSAVQVKRRTENSRSYKLLEDLGTKPSITYFARVRSRQS